MTKNKTIRMALVGTDSLRSREIKNILEKKSAPSDVVEFYDPNVKGAFGKLTEFRGEARVIHHLDPTLLDGLDVVFLTADSKSNQRIIDKAASLNITAIFFNDETNGEERPHPVSAMLSHFLHVAMNGADIREIVVTVLQPASAYLDDGIAELADQSTAFLGSLSSPRSKFKTPLAFNLVSQTESVDEEGVSASERRIHREVRRILGKEDLPLSLSLIQVPVFHTYGLMIYVRLGEERTLADLERLFDESPSFKKCGPGLACPVSSLTVAGKDEIYIGQIKKDPADDHAFWFWLVGDNLTRGSALNAYEIARKVIALRRAE